MKLLFIMFDGENFTGGPTINMTRLLPVLVDRGYVVEVLCFYLKAHPNADFLESKNITCHLHEQTLMTYRSVPWIFKKAEEINPDVFIPDISTQGLIAGKWLKEKGIRVINTLRGNDKLNWGKAIYFSKQSLWQSSAIVCVSKYLKEQLQQKITLNIPSVIIPSGVEYSKNKSNQFSEIINILYTGRFVKRQKDIDAVLNLFIKLAKLDKRFCFNLIGHGPEQNNLLNRIKSEELSDRIKLHLPLRGEAYKTFLAQHQIMVLLSDHEGTPGAIMDGMSCGLIPVVYKIEGIEKLIINNATGFIVGDKENEPLNKIMEIIDKPELREELSLNAKAHIKSYYSIDYCADQWELLFKHLNIGERLPFKKPIFYKLPPKNKLLLEHLTIPLGKMLRYRLKQFLNRP
jgi:glycosyltransferase involved in cell wall biosynthesis